MGASAAQLGITIQPLIKPVFLHRIRIALLAGLLLCRAVPLSAQCSSGYCQPQSPVPEAVVRIINQSTNGTKCYGSGTLIKTDDRRGIVLSCAHLFEPRSAIGRVLVLFHNGRTYEAEILAIDRTWDISVLAIQPPEATPIVLADEAPRPGEPLQSCGYGPNGQYICQPGKAIGYVQAGNAATRETLEVSGGARQGDSGGPIFNRRGQLVAVLWGTDGRTIGGTFCGRIRKILARVLRIDRDRWQTIPERPIRLPSPPRPEIAQGGKRENIPATKGTGRVPIDKDAIRSIARDVALKALADRAPAALERWLPKLMIALGWTGPPSVAVLLGLKLLLAMLRHRSSKSSMGASSLLHRRRSSRRRRAPRHPPAIKEPLNDDYAEQLARVYALSGRSPLADATLGREYDEELRNAATSSDATLAHWAQRLRDRVAKRFYRIHSISPSPAEPA